ncbi:MAG: isochorismate synthase, partial [Myxococcota bacterium]|nr:isochorismate synthase [Myxococcota bacterium]
MRLEPRVVEAGVERALRRADRLGRAQWIAASFPVEARDALDCFSESPDRDRFFWEHPSEELQIAALGAADAIESASPADFEAVAREVTALLDDLHRIGVVGVGSAEPLLVGGFSFSNEHQPEGDWRGFPASRLVLPERILIRRPGGALCRVVQRVEPGADAAGPTAALCERIAAWPDGRPTGGRRSQREGGVRGGTPGDETCRTRARPDDEAYRAGVDAALRAIAAGDLEKVVLARSVRLEREDAFDADAVLASLRRHHPSCATFAVARGDAAFVGATPELLVRLAKDHVYTSALAGSAPRGRGPEEDARLARELLESKKEQAEHAIVVRALREGIEPLCHDVVQTESPRLRRLEGIQHLETPVEGRLREGATLLDLLARLHPTPAVGGAPRPAALEWIASHESIRRGWYAGPVGYLDDRG